MIPTLTRGTSVDSLIRCSPSFTCAPYLDATSAPSLGEHVGWAESNAVLYANSALGARTQK